MSAFTSQKGGEIVTLSFGPNSNWTSRCFWELQERHHQLSSLRPSTTTSAQDGSNVSGRGGSRGNNMMEEEGESYGEQLGVASQARQSEIAQMYASHGVRRSVHYGGTSNKRWPRAIFFDLKDSPISTLAGGGAASLRGISSMMGGSVEAQEAARGASRGNGIVGATTAARSVWGGDVIVHRTAPSTGYYQSSSSSSSNNVSDASGNGNSNASSLSLQEVADMQEKERGPPSTWADRWYPRLHSKSLNVLQEYRQGVARFDVYTHGYEVLASSGSEESEKIFESFRCQLEDCDRVQGFQVLCDCDSGFGGLTQDFLVEYVKEECRSASILTYGLMDSLTMSNMDRDSIGGGEASGRGGSSGISLGGNQHQSNSTMRARAIAYRSINQGLALSHLSDCSSLFVPIHAESLHNAAEATMWSRHCEGSMAPLQTHQAAALLASSIDTILLPFRVNSSSSSIKPLSSMDNLVRSIVSRRELNIATLLTRFEMPLSFPAKSIREMSRGKERVEWNDLHAYLSWHAPMHRVGGSSISSTNSSSNFGSGGGANSSTGHTAKSGGTGASTTSSSVVDDDRPCLLWSLSGNGMSTAYSSYMSSDYATNTNVTYGAHSVVRGYHGESTVTVGRHNLTLNVLLDIYLHRTKCRNQSLSSFVIRAPVSVSDGKC
jgi:hypothetical protein